MKTSENKTTASNRQQQQTAEATPAPFFQKEGGTAFFSQATPDVQAFFNKNESAAIQPKLTVGQPDDKYEVEADSVADSVVQGFKNQKVENNPTSGQTLQTQEQTEEDIQQKRGIDIQKKSIFESNDDSPMIQSKAIRTPHLQKQSTAKEEEQVQKQEEEEAAENGLDLQKKPIFESGAASPPEDESPPVQRKSDSEVGTSPDLQSRLNDSKGSGTALPKDTQSSMGSAMGADFSNVRVHTGSEAVQMSQDLGAQAFTHGSDIYFNEGKYDTGSSSGQHLLAHELTHTVQQGAAKPSIQKEETSETEPTRPNDPIDITHRFDPNEAWQAYLETQTGRRNRNVEVPVKIGSDYTGTISVRRLSRRTTANRLGRYRLSNNQVGRYYLDVNGMNFLNPLRNAGVHPVLVLRPFGEEGQTTGFLSIRNGNTAVGNVIGLIRGINEHLEAMQFLGLEPITIPGGSMENAFENGGLTFQIAQLSTVIDGFLEVGGGMGIVGSNFTFNLNTNVDIEGLASGEFTLSREENGNLSGRANIQADIANVNASILVEYQAGVVTIQGTGRMQSEKFSGEITLLVTDRARSTQMMQAALGVQSMEAEAENTETPSAPKTPDNQVLAGWGEVTATITPWLEGTAKIGIDAAGHVTIVGELVVTDEVELMEQRGKKTDLFDVEIRAGYGIPLVGQVFLFASIGMFMNAGFGPLVLRDIRFEGTYSTDPAILQQFTITGSLGINAFAVLGLEAEAGVGLTLLGHDVKAGVNVTAAAGLRAYASATPTFEYVESQAPEGGKVGEAHLRGHFEAAAQLFLQLSGALFYELDSPWWSPAPDGREESPLGEVQYPIGDSMGIGADIDWLVGSPDIPEIEFSPVEFDPEQFTADVMADPPPHQRGNNEENPQGEWQDGSAQGNLDADPSAQAGGEGLPGGGRQEENLRNLPDEQKYMRGLSEISDIADAREKPTVAVVETKINRIKNRYGLNRVRIQTENDDHVLIFVSHARQDNGNNLVNVPIMSVAERIRLLHEAMEDLTTRMNRQAGDAGTLTQADAQTLAETWHTAHPIIESVRVVDDQDSWDFQVDIGDRNERVPGKGKAELTANVEENWWEIREEFTDQNREDHSLYFEGTGDDATLILASEPTHIGSWVNTRRRELTEKNDLSSDKANALNRISRTLMPEIRKITHPNPHQPSTMTIEEILEDLSTQIRIIGIDDEKPVPRMLVTPGFSSNKANGTIQVKFIFKNQHNHQPGTPTTGREDLHGAFTEIRSLGVSARWRRGHLLNKDFGGKASNSNLIPIPESINQGAFPAFDNPMRVLYNSEEVLYMTIRVSRNHNNDPNSLFVSNLIINGGVMKFESEQWSPDGNKDTFSLNETIEHPSKSAELTTSLSLNDIIMKGSDAKKEEIRKVGRSNGLSESLVRELIANGNTLNSIDDIRTIVRNSNRTDISKTRTIARIDRAETNHLITL